MITFKNRRIRTIDILWENDDPQYQTYCIHPEESGTLFTFRGNNKAPFCNRAVVMCLPPIDLGGGGMTFGFKAGPVAPLHLYTHHGHVGGYGAEYLLKGYYTVDCFSNYYSTNLQNIVTWSIWAGYTNATRWFISMPNDPPERGGKWVWIQDENNMGHGNFVADPPITSQDQWAYDWYNYRWRNPPDGKTNLRHELSESNTQQTMALQRKFYYYKILDPDKPKINKTSNYELSASETESMVTNEGATSDVTFTLPQTEPGLHFWFTSKANKVGGVAYPNLIVRSQPGNYIQGWHEQPGHEYENQIYYSGINGHIQLLATEHGNWEFMHQVPEWDIGDPYNPYSTSRPSVNITTDYHITTATENNSIIEITAATNPLTIFLPPPSYRKRFRIDVYTDGLMIGVQPPSGTYLSWYGEINPSQFSGILTTTRWNYTELVGRDSTYWLYTNPYNAWASGVA